MEVNWEKKASNILKAELKIRGLSYKELIEKLASIGVEETIGSLTVKINRGSFSFLFFLQVMQAIEAKTLRLEDE